MSGVAVALEVARLLLPPASLPHDVIFLFDDGEEAGVLGATAFVRHHPWAADVRDAVDLDARGSHGPSLFAASIAPGSTDSAVAAGELAFDWALPIVYGSIEFARQPLPLAHRSAWRGGPCRPTGSGPEPGG